MQSSSRQSAGKRIGALAWRAVDKAIADGWLAVDHSPLVFQALASMHAGIERLDLPDGCPPDQLSLGEPQLACEPLFAGRLGMSSFRRTLVYRQVVEPGSEKFLALTAAPVGFLFLILILYVACDRLHFPEEWKLVPENVFGLRFVLHQLFEAAAVVAVTWIVLRLVDFFGLVLIERARETEDRSDDQLVPFVKEGIKVILAGVGLLITLAVCV